MKIKTKELLVPFILMIIFNLSIYSIFHLNYGARLHPHVGIVFISGLFFGPYGALGASVGNLLCDMFRGYPIGLSISSWIVTFGIALFGYRLWYEPFRLRGEVSKPKLNTTINFIYFIAIIVMSAFLYSLLHQKLILIFSPEMTDIIYRIGLRYWLNFLNSAFIMGIIGIWVFEKVDYFHVPKRSKKHVNKTLYTIIELLLVISVIFAAITDNFFSLNISVQIGETIWIVALLYAYITKPIDCEVKELKTHSTSESIMNKFLMITLLMVIFGYALASNTEVFYLVFKNFPIALILIIYLIPSIGVLRYIERKVIEPVAKFSQIEGIIKEGYKIESEDLIKTYAEYADEENEIGDLARSYTELIHYNNNYIENIKEIEGERERIKTELNIAENIQRANLPTDYIENDNILVYGYSKPAKEVGGDFFDYYNLDDDNLVVVIGDASGKGIPAALLSVITQNLIKQMVKTTRDPSKILESLNNQFCENNPEAMFITLWLGIYNKKTNKIIYSNAGHNPPLIKENRVLKKLEGERGIVIGVLDNFEYASDESDIGDGLILYTDGITDANNEDRELYGENRLIKFLNSTELNSNLIDNLLDDIHEFTDGAEQFDDITMLLLIRKNEK